MNKQEFYARIDRFPLIRTMQLMAVVVFVLAVLQILLASLPAIFSGYALIPSLLALLTGLATATFMPLALLAFAEIIKLLRRLTKATMVETTK